MGFYGNRLLRIAVGLALLTSAVLAQQTVTAGVAVVEIAPIFHQLVAFNAPANLTRVSEHTTDKFYIREAVAQKETVDQWTQMLTVTGARGLAHISGMTPMRMSQSMAAGYKKSCPDTFAVRGVGNMTISGQPAYLLFVGCGSVEDAQGAPGALHSEAAMIVVIAGDEDYYTIQLAERGAPTKTLVFDDAVWKPRYQALQPIHICPIVTGEKAPYPSCVGK